MIGSILLGFLPSFLQVPVRRLLGQKIGKGSKIRIGTILSAKKVAIGDKVTIGPFCYVKAEELSIGNNSRIKALSMVSTRIIKFAQYVHIAPLSIISSEFTENSKIEIGDHSRIFPFCWLDTGEGIRIGAQTSVGSHSFIYTHGAWSDYLQGAPIVYGPVTIHDNVWIPTRVTILPNVEIGEYTIIGTNSLVNKSFANNLLIGGTPAKVLREGVNAGIGPEQKRERVNEILNSFSSYLNFMLKIKSECKEDKLIFQDFKIALDDDVDLNDGDLLMLVNKSMEDSEIDKLISSGISILCYKEKRIKIAQKNIVWTNFISYLRRYGIRLYIE